MRRASLLLVLAAMVFVASRALAAEAEPGFELLPGASRAIPRTTSASRDTPLFEMAYGPRIQASVGGDFGIVAWRGADVSMRFGMYALLALENESKSFFPHDYWRGLLGFSAALSFDAAARAWLGEGGGFELALVAGHESDHVTDRAQESGARGLFHGVQNFLALDAAVRVPLGSWGRALVRARYGKHVASQYAHAAAADVELRWLLSPKAQPTIAFFAEHLVGAKSAPDCDFARLLVGVALVGRVGEATPFVSGDAGCRKGLVPGSIGAQISFGIRYAPF